MSSPPQGGSLYVLWRILCTRNLLLHLQSYFFFPSMSKWVVDYMKRFSLFNQAKPSSRELGLHQPLLVHSRPWECISMYFINSLTTTQRKHDCIFVFLRRSSKIVVFIPFSKSINSLKYADLFFHHVWSNFGVWLTIRSDCDFKFFSHFFWSLWKPLWWTLRFSINFTLKVTDRQR